MDSYFFRFRLRGLVQPGWIVSNVCRQRESFSVMDSTVAVQTNGFGSLFHAVRNASMDGKYVTLSIPESVVLRVHLRLTQQTLQTSLAARNPLRVIKLRKSNTAVAKQPRHITDLKSLQKPANRAGVAEPVRTAVGDTAA